MCQITRRITGIQRKNIADLALFPINSMVQTQVRQYSRYVLIIFSLLHCYSYES